MADVPAASPKHGKRPQPKVRGLAAKPAALKELGKGNHRPGPRADAGLSPISSNRSCMSSTSPVPGHQPRPWTAAPTGVSAPLPESIREGKAARAIAPSLPPTSAPHVQITFGVCPRLAWSKPSHTLVSHTAFLKWGTPGPRSFLRHAASPRLSVFHPAWRPAEGGSVGRLRQRRHCCQSPLWPKRDSDVNSRGFNLVVSLIQL